MDKSGFVDANKSVLVLIGELQSWRISRFQLSKHNISALNILRILTFLKSKTGGLKMIKGYINKILRVNLSNGEYRDETAKVVDPLLRAALCYRFLVLETFVIWFAVQLGVSPS